MTGDWHKWVDTATFLISRFKTAAEHLGGDEEFAAAWDMMEFLKETVVALKSNDLLDRDD